MDANPQAPHRIRVPGGQPVSSSFRPGESSLRYEAKPYGPAEGPGAGLSNCWASGICSIARPAGLSGGERQRAGIARALALGPQLLLMDEPLSALDYRRRQEILPYLERLRAELAIPRIYVSHAPEEVARLADHLIVVDDGRVQASGSLSESLLLARMTRRAAALLGIAPGKLFWVQVKSVMLLH